MKPSPPVQSEPALVAQVMSAAAKPKPWFPAECLEIPGLIGDIMAFNSRTSYTPQPELALASALALMSLLVGQKVTDANRTRPNVYIVGLSKTGAGKDAGRSCNKQILAALNCTDLTEDDIGSDSGFTNYVADFPNCLLQIDEVGYLFGSMKSAAKMSWMVGVGKELLKLFTSANTFYKTKLLSDRSKRKTIHYPNVVLLGTATGAGFWDSLPSTAIADGLLGRCMVFDGRDYQTESQTPSLEDVPESILLRARHWLDLKTHSGNLAGTLNQGYSPLLIPHTPEAWDRSCEHRNGIHARRTKEDDNEAALWSRASEKTNKLAMLFACSRCEVGETPVISLDDINLAIKLTNALTRRMLTQASLYMSETPHHKRVNFLRQFVTKEQTLTDINRKTQPWTKKEREEAIVTLLESEDFIRGERLTKGRKAQTLKPSEA